MLVMSVDSGVMDMVVYGLSIVAASSMMCASRLLPVIIATSI